MNTVRVSRVFLGISKLLLLAGCANGVFNVEPYSDTKRDAHGKVALADTPREWRDFIGNVDIQIENEMKGSRPPGVATWSQHWDLIIKYMEGGHQENAQKYVAYIINKRREVGLPEIEDGGN